MPRDLVLVRHGESEGNVAVNKSKKGDHSEFTPEFTKRHSMTWTLTPKGWEQVQMARDWILENMDPRFDRHYVSPWFRAMQTAAGLELPDALWYEEFYLREREWGALDVMSTEERERRFADDLRSRKVNPFFWRPTRGESMADVCLRGPDRHFETLHRECDGKRVIVVNHGDLMWAYRVRLEHMSPQRFLELDQSKHPWFRIHNCQILHYTRVNPETGEMAPRLMWMRSICPTDLSFSSNEWETIERPRYTNEQLLAEVAERQRVFGSSGVSCSSPAEPGEVQAPAKPVKDTK